MARVKAGDLGRLEHLAARLVREPSVLSFSFDRASLELTETFEKVSKEFGPRFETLWGRHGPSKMVVCSLGSRRLEVCIPAEMEEGFAKAEVAASQQMSVSRSVSPCRQDLGMGLEMDLGIGFWSYIGKWAG